MVNDVNAAADKSFVVVVSNGGRRTFLGRVSPRSRVIWTRNIRFACRYTEDRARMMARDHFRASAQPLSSFV